MRCLGFLALALSGYAESGFSDKAALSLQDASIELRYAEQFSVSARDRTEQWELEDSEGRGLVHIYDRLHGVLNTLVAPSVDEDERQGAETVLLEVAASVTEMRKNLQASEKQKPTFGDYIERQ